MGAGRRSPVRKGGEKKENGWYHYQLRNMQGLDGALGGGQRPRPGHRPSISGAQLRQQQKSPKASSPADQITPVPSEYGVNSLRVKGIFMVRQPPPGFPLIMELGRLYLMNRGSTHSITPFPPSTLQLAPLQNYGTAEGKCPAGYNERCRFLVH